MKKIFLLMLSVTTLLSNGKTNQNDWFLTGGPKVHITVKFGNTIDCTGWGICEIKIGVNGLTGSLEVDSGEGGSWILTIPRDTLLRYEPKFLNKFEGQSSVYFDETYILPQEVKKAAGSDAELIIRANNMYPVRYINGSYEIRFPL